MSFHPASKYLVCGASSGIGLALVFQALENHEADHVFATHRSSSDLSALQELQNKYPGRLTLCPLEATNEADYEVLAKTITSQTDSIDYIFNAIAVLHDQVMNPERQITDVKSSDFTTSMQTNTLPTLLLGKYLKDLIRIVESADDEFSDWCWMTMSEAIAAVVPFKQDLYRRLGRVFDAHLDNAPRNADHEENPQGDSG